MHAVVNRKKADVVCNTRNHPGDECKGILHMRAQQIIKQATTES